MTCLGGTATRIVPATVKHSDGSGRGIPAPTGTLGGKLQRDRCDPIDPFRGLKRNPGHSTQTARPMTVARSCRPSLSIEPRYGAAGWYNTTGGSHQPTVPRLHQQSWHGSH